MTLEWDATYVHVYPLNDWREHVTAGEPCWCHPFEDEETGAIVHNSMDGREAYESGERLPS